MFLNLNIHPTIVKCLNRVYSYNFNYFFIVVNLLKYISTVEIIADACMALNMILEITLFSKQSSAVLLYPYI